MKFRLSTVVSGGKLYAVVIDGAKTYAVCVEI